MSTPDVALRYEFTLEIVEAFGHDADLVTPVSTAALGQEAPRPADSSLDSTALYEAVDH